MSNPPANPSSVPASLEDRPYLSVVASSRNDNHGGDLLTRMQLFIDGLSEQCRRHRLPTELLMIEWNPRPDRPKLTEALCWPTNNPFLTTRVIEVPTDLHMRFDYAANLPLFQMMFYNRAVFERLGLYDIQYKTGADYVYCIKAFGDDAIEKIYVDAVIAEYEGGGLSTTYNDQELRRDRPGLILKHLGWKPYLALKLSALIPWGLREARARRRKHVGGGS